MIIRLKALLFLILIASPLVGGDFEVSISGRYSAAFKSAAFVSSFEASGMPFNSDVDSIRITLSPSSSDNSDSLIVWMDFEELDLSDTSKCEITSNSPNLRITTIEDLAQGAEIICTGFSNINDIWISINIFSVTWDENYTSDFLLESSIITQNFEWLPQEPGNLWQYHHTYDDYEGGGYDIIVRHELEGCDSSDSLVMSYNVRIDSLIDGVWSAPTTSTMDFFPDGSITGEADLLNFLNPDLAFWGSRDYADGLSYGCYSDVPYWYPQGEGSYVNKYGLGFVRHSVYGASGSWREVLTGGIIDGDAWGTYIPLSTIPVQQTPESFALEVFPNPFNSSIKIQYELPQNEDVSITIYDIGGRLIWEQPLVSGRAGQHHLYWNGLNAADSEVQSGLYIVQFEMGSLQHTKKIILLH